MSLSDCEKCWDTPCTCGWEYRAWTPDNLTALIATLEQVRDRRLRGVPDPREVYDRPQPPMKPIDWGRAYRITDAAMREAWAVPYNPFDDLLKRPKP